MHSKLVLTSFPTVHRLVNVACVYEEAMVTLAPP